MNHKDRKEFIEGEFQKMLAITQSKGIEYANSDDDANANFKEIGAKLGIDPKTVLWIYATKHFQAITSFVKKGQVFSNEPIDGRVHDLALYCLLLLSLIKEENEARGAIRETA